jgi:glyoxylase-like metal-dependent hydrolase (beta-lactamase superfamily II)
MEGPDPLGKPLDPVEDGTILEYGGRKLQCVFTPGHTPGHMCLYDRENEILFSGDHVLFHISPNICRWEGVDDSLGSYLKSLERVKSLPVRHLYPAHREETGNLKTRVEELEAHHAKRLLGTKEIVRDNPGLTAYDIAGKMRWSIRAKSWVDFPLTQKFFAVGEALAHLDYLEKRGEIQREKSGDKVHYFSN